MASTYSTNLAIELIGTGDQAGSWGNTTNTNLGTLIEQAISGYVTQAVSTGTDTTITIPNGATGVARNMYIELTGTGGASTNLIVPANKKLYFIFNNSTGAVTVKVSGQTGVSVPQGKKVVLVCNGTDIVNGLNYIADFGSNSATITQLTATSATITNLTLTSLVISNLSIASANITTLTSASATITNLLGTTLTISGNSFLATSSGNVGVGTTSPAAKLEAYNSAVNGAFVANTLSTWRVAQIRNDQTGTSGSAAGIAFVGKTDTQPAGIVAINGNTTGGVVSLGFLTVDSNVTTERMRITSDGNLGLGVTPSAWNPVYRAFNIGSRGFVYSRTDNDETSIGVNWYRNSSAAYVFAQNGYATSYIQGSGVHAWYNSTNNTSGANASLTLTQAMTLDTVGNLGIGTTSPAVKLDVQGSATDFVAFNGLNTNNNAGTITSSAIKFGFTSTVGTHYATLKITEDSANSNSGGLTISLPNGGVETPLLALTSAGNLGIGTASPSTYSVAPNLVVSTATNGGMTIRTGSSNYGAVFFADGTTGDEQYRGGIQYNHDYLGSTDTLLLVTAGTTKARLDSSGNLGLGVTPSAWGVGSWRGFEVGASGALAFTGSGTNDLSLSTNSYNNGSNWIYKYTGDGAARYSMTATGVHRWYYAGTGTAGNTISFTQAMTLDASGNLVVGNTTANERLEIYKGISYNADPALYFRIGANDGAVNNNAPYTWRTGITGSASGYSYVFQTLARTESSWVERGRFTAGGDLLVGTTSTAFTGRVVTLQTTSASNVITAWNSATSGDNSLIGFFTDGGTGRGSITYNRVGGLVAYNTTSDYRAKDILGPVQNSGATIDALKVYEGQMKGASQSRPMLVAHEAQEHAPYAVTGEKDAVNEDGTPKFQQMDTSSLVPLLIAEIQSLRSRVAALEAK